MTIEASALELNQIISQAYKDPHKALNTLNMTKTPMEISHLRDAALVHIALLCKPERKPRTSADKD